MFPIYAWPQAILHLDGNAFFASVMQAARPKLQGKPVVVGQERGIATAISYEARVFGVKRGMVMSDIRRLCPQVIILPGDYELFSLYSQRMFTVLRRWSPMVEEYSVDEGFADLTGLRGPLRLSYQEIAQKIQAEIKNELNLPVSVGVSLTKSLAKLASGFRKPLGITIVSGRQIESFLQQVPLENIWGVGRATSSYLHKFNLKTALDFAKLPVSVFQKGETLKLHKPHWEIWQELRGEVIYSLNPEVKNEYQSISKTRTFRPSTRDPQILWAELLANIEAAFQKARAYNYRVKKLGLFLKTSRFHYSATEIKLPEPAAYPLLCRQELRTAFKKIYSPQEEYRTTGCTLFELSQQTQTQGQLFVGEPVLKPQKAKALYQVLEENRQKIDFGSSLYLKKNRATKTAVNKDKPSRLNIPILEI